MPYTPKPIDTAGVRLSEDVEKLTEALARNAHEQWARQRLAEGWALGPRRDDRKKHHPCLVPYEELPDSEKQYDRITAMETVRVILALGYQIIPPDRSQSIGVDVLKAEDEAMGAVLDFLRDRKSGDMSVFLALWRSRKPQTWARYPEVYRLLADRMLGHGEPLAAYDVLAEGLASWGDDVRLQQLSALSLARSGALERAAVVLDKLLEEGHNDAETLGIRGRVHKDLWERESDPTAKTRHLQKSFAAYDHAYRLTGEYWTGINAATTALLAGQSKRAQELARRVQTQCAEELERQRRGGGDQYWTLATLGEAALVLGDVASATGWYAQAAREGRGRLGDIGSTRRQCRLLLEHLGHDCAEIESHFAIPQVHVFTGAISPAPRTTQLSFEAHGTSDDRLVRAMAEQLERLGARIGCASLAGVEDIVFLEAMHATQGETHVVLPYARESLLTDIAAIAGPSWRDRCGKAINRATTVAVASEHRSKGSPMSFAHAVGLLFGLASIRARQLGTGLVALSARADRSGAEPLQVIKDIVATRRALTPPDEMVDPESGYPVQVKALLFADAKGFSRFTDEAVPLFVRHFLGLVARVTESGETTPTAKNTWGDGLYMVFDNLRDAALLALDLRDEVERTDWAAHGIPDGLSLRIALHAGPVYRCTDPVTGATGYFGSHVSSAARIEPITPPGEVYASLAFAAMLALSGADDVSCQYVGNTAWAKGYGSYPTFHVRRAGT